MATETMHTTEPIDQAPPPAAEAAPAPPPPAEPQAPPASKKAPIGFGKSGVIISTLAELWRFAEIILDSGMAPRGMDTVAKITVAIQFGAEFGVPALASVRGVAVIEGQPSWKGDMALALVRASGLCAGYKKWHEGEGMKRKAFVATQRTDSTEPMVTEFSVDDAVLAGLWGMTSSNGRPMPWSQYPDRMLYYRALGFNLRDNFPEVMKGTVTAEERADYPPATDIKAVSASTSRPALNPAPPVDPLLESIGVIQRKKTGDPVNYNDPAAAAAARQAQGEPGVVTPWPALPEEIVLVPPAADCKHPLIPPSRLRPGRVMTCPDCGEALHGDPVGQGK